MLASSVMAAGCAAGPDPRDPYEKFNRNVYSFNEGVDKAILKPAAKGYVAVVPTIARQGVTNFFNNLGMLVTTLNDALQLKGTKVPVDFARFTTNLVFGLGGVIDVASSLQIENRNEDFGQTLGYWGLGSGPYIVLPFFGPSSVRDGTGILVDFVVSPFVYVTEDEAAVRWGLFALDLVDSRANLLSAEKFIDQASLDRYSFLRDSYMQRREYLIYDGHPPKSGEEREKSLKELEEEDLSNEPVAAPVPLRTVPRTTIKP